MRPDGKSRLRGLSSVYLGPECGCDLLDSQPGQRCQTFCRNSEELQRSKNEKSDKSHFKLSYFLFLTTEYKANPFPGLVSAWAELVQMWTLCWSAQNQPYCSRMRMALWETTCACSIISFRSEDDSLTWADTQVFSCVPEGDLCRTVKEHQNIRGYHMSGRKSPDWSRAASPQDVNLFLVFLPHREGGAPVLFTLQFVLGAESVRAELRLQRSQLSGVEQSLSGILGGFLISSRAALVYAVGDQPSSGGGGPSLCCMLLFL